GRNRSGEERGRRRGEEETRCEPRGRGHERDEEQVDREERRPWPSRRLEKDPAENRREKADLDAITGRDGRVALCREPERLRGGDREQDPGNEEMRGVGNPGRGLRRREEADREQRAV